MNNKIKLDLLIIDTHDPLTLGVGDISFYPQGLSILSPTIEITPPGWNKVTLPFTAKNLTIYNSNLLGITCSDVECGYSDLPDGIWKIKYSITPANERFVEKSFYRTEAIQRNWATSFLYTDVNKCDGKAKLLQKQTLDEIWSLIQGAIADANECNDMAANNKYQLASSMLKNYNKTNGYGM